MSLQKLFHPVISGKSKTEPAISIQAIVWPISTTSQLQSVLIINCSSLIAEQPDRDSCSQVESCVFVMGTSMPRLHYGQIMNRHKIFKIEPGSEIIKIVVFIKYQPDRIGL